MHIARSIPRSCAFSTPVKKNASGPIPITGSRHELLLISNDFPVEWHEEVRTVVKGCMTLRINGQIFRSRRSGLGRSRWRTEEFSCVVAEGTGGVEAGEGLIFECVSNGRGWVLQGTVRNVPCLFGEIGRGEEGQGFRFAMISVARVEVRGQATVLSEDTEERGGPVKPEERAPAEDRKRFGARAVTPRL